MSTLRVFGLLLSAVLAAQCAVVSAQTTIEENATEVVDTTPLTPEQFVRKWLMEIGMSVLIVLYLVNFLIGKSTNEKLARSWMHANKDLFEKNFAEIGIGEGGQKGYLSRESYSSYKFYASGRVNCLYALVSLELKRRQDLLSTLLLDLYSPSFDSVVVEVAMAPEELDSFVLACGKAKVIKTMATNASDLKALTRKRKSPLPDSLTVIADCDEVVEDVLNPQVVKVLKACEKHFIALHISDRHPGLSTRHTRGFRFEFKLPSGAAAQEEAAQLMRLAVYLIDVVASTRLSPHAKAAAEKERQRLEEEAFKATQQERMEKLQQKKADKKKQQEVAEQQLSKEQQRKKEEKEYRQSLKKAGPRMRLFRG